MPHKLQTRCLRDAMTAWMAYAAICLSIMCALACTSCASTALTEVSPTASPRVASTTVDRTSVPILPFTTIAQEASLGDHPIEPLYTIVARPDEWDELRGRLPDQAIEAGIRAGPSSDDLIVVAFAGVKGNSGHSITVENIDHDKGQVIVTVLQTGPGPDDIVEPAYTLPYHLVAFDESSLHSARPLTFTFRDPQGTVLGKNVTVEPTN